MQADISVLPKAGCLLKQPKQILYSKCANWETLQHHRPSFALGNSSKHWYLWDHTLRTASISPSSFLLNNSGDCYNIWIAEESFLVAEILLSHVGLSAIMGTYPHSMLGEQMREPPELLLLYLNWNPWSQLTAVKKCQRNTVLTLS